MTNTLHTYCVHIYLAENMRESSFLGYGEDPAKDFTDAFKSGSYKAAHTFRVAALDDRDALSAVWQIANSYPEEMFCDPTYVLQVRQYRRGRNRSLSVGDVAVVERQRPPIANRDERHYYGCCPVGWTEFTPTEVV